MDDGGASSEKIQNPLYRFNTRGRLLGARGYPMSDSSAGDLYLTYHCKQKGIIYASDEDTIYLFREEDK